MVVLLPSVLYTMRFFSSIWRLHHPDKYPHVLHLNQFVFFGNGFSRINAEAGERLCLPDSYKGNPVGCWNMTKVKEQLPKVKTICLPNTITHISISNEVFPNLEKVELQAGQTAFSTDGKMLFSADGRELLYSLAAGNCDKAIVPGTVKKIAVTAFQNTVCSEIVFENPDVSVEGNAFSGSEWLKKQGEYNQGEGKWPAV